MTPTTPARRTPGRSRRLVTVSIIVVLICVVVAAAGAWMALYLPDNAVEPGLPVQIEVPRGASTARIATILAEAGVVPNATMFRVRSRLAGADGHLKAGVYELATGMPYDYAIERLKQGAPIRYVTVTIPEGWVLGQIAARLEKQAGIPKDEFLDLARTGAKEFADEHPYLNDAYKGSLEGYLFPKTYRFRHDTTAREAIEVMLDQFDKEIARVDMDYAVANGLTVPQVVTIASIVEKETKIPKERPLVSSVIYNRLDRDMKLEICSTVEYILRGNRFRLTYKETRTPSPYNTYLHKGLTPGPIANPGLASLKAAASPADTDFIFYVLTGRDGSQTFASTAADFAKAKRKSKEVFGR